MAALILVGVPRHPVGRLMAAVGALSAVAVFAASWPGWLPLAWLGQWLVWPPIGLMLLALLLFPDGALPSRRWRPLAYLIVAAIVVGAVALAVAAIDHPDTFITRVEVPWTERAWFFRRIARWTIIVTGAALLGVLWSLVVRWRRATGVVRQQLACLLPAAVLLLLSLVLDAIFAVPGLFVIAALAVPVAMTVAVLRHQLYGLDRIVSRSTVWLVMTLLVIVGFIAIVALFRVVFVGDSTSNASLVATGLIAVAFEPVRRRVQHGVDHLIYGDRDDPYVVIARLGGLLGRTTEPQAVLPELASEIARSMQVPYVALEVPDGNGSRLVAEHGERTATIEAFDMLAHAKCQGRLLVATRTDDGHFARHERRLLTDAAVHAGVAVEATRLVRDLQESRDQIIRAREEERRRLRRDLHDNVRPNLAGVAMQVRAAHKAAGDAARVRDLLDSVSGDLQTCMLEVHALVDQLRPPELDCGLDAALRAECRRFTDDALSIDLWVEDSLEGLPAAIEVAAYRIVGEALHNVARHARAQTCRVTVNRHRSLTVEIVDDGIGIGAAATSLHGVGLESMRERAREVGGACVISAAVPRGTSVRVELPIN